MAFNRDLLKAGELRNCERCATSIEGCKTIGGEIILAVETAVESGGTVWVGESLQHGRICAELGGPLLELAREHGIGLRHFHIHPEGR